MSNTTNAKYHKCQWEEASSPDSTTGKFPAAASCGSREIFIPAAVLPRTDLTIF